MSPGDALRAAVLRLIREGGATDDEDLFRDLALRVFEHQFAENEPYRRFCQRRRVTPGSVSDWPEIPAVPTAAFKEAPLICGGPEAAEIVFRTSGTTEGPQRRGAHYVRDLRLYDAAAVSSFRRHVVPGVKRIHTVVLGPGRDLAPESSLTWMFERIRAEFGTPASGFYVDERGLMLEPLLRVLEGSEREGRPIALLGTAAAFAHLLEILEGRGRRFRLPSGSRALETGGFKGMRREIPRDEFYAMLTRGLGLSEFYCIAEYGMTEMCSQFYDNVLRERSLGRSPEMRFKETPGWVRTRVVDAETLEPVPHGEPGVLRHFDLANLDSVMAIQTDDLGVAADEGFEILGRATGAELRGCSIAIDQWLTAQR